MRPFRVPLVALAVLAGCASAPQPAPAPVSSPAPPVNDPDAPRYKPSASSPAPIDITTNAYGAFSGAPDAPELGDRAQDFTLPLADGGMFDLAQARTAGPVLVMFYRGHW